MDKLKLRFALSLWLPLFAVVFSAAIVLFPAGRLYLRWKAAIGNNDKLLLSSGEFQAMIPRGRMLRSAVEMNAVREQGTISVLNAPGHLLGALPHNLLCIMRTGSPTLLDHFSGEH